VSASASPDRQVQITREALRDGTLLALARAAMPPGTIMRSDAEIEADLDRTLVHHPPGPMSGCSATVP